MAASGRFRPHGFTLIELVTTLLIIGVLAVFAIGKLDFTSTFDQKATRDKLLASLQFARKAAVAQRRSSCVAVGGNNVTFTLDTRSPDTTGATFCDGSSAANLNLPASDRSCGGASNKICAPSGVTITANNAGFSFDAAGTATTTTRFTITGAASITCGDGNSASLCVEATSGYVH